MAISYNGTTIENITFNGTQLDKVVFNGVTVWENYSKPFIDSTSSQSGGTGTTTTMPSNKLANRKIKVITVRTLSDRNHHVDSAGHNTMNVGMDIVGYGNLTAGYVYNQGNTTQQLNDSNSVNITRYTQVSQYSEMTFTFSVPVEITMLRAWFGSGVGTWGNNGSRITISGFEKP